MEHIQPSPDQPAEPDNSTPIEPLEISAADAEGFLNTALVFAHQQNALNKEWANNLPFTINNPLREAIEEYLKQQTGAWVKLVKQAVGYADPVNTSAENQPEETK